MRQNEPGKRVARPLVVALIGPLASGKSVVREALARRGAAIIDFDRYSRDLLRPGTPEYQQLGEQLGPQCFRPDGTVDRAAVAGMIFADVGARERLNAIVHPAMLARLCQVVADFRRQPTAPLLVVEGAILRQLPTEGLFDVVLRVQAPAPVRVQRLQERDSLSREGAQQRVRLHQTMGVGGEAADFVIETGENRESVEPQADRFWNEFVGPTDPSGGEPNPFE